MPARATLARKPAPRAAGGRRTSAKASVKSPVAVAAKAPPRRAPAKAAPASGGRMTLAAAMEALRGAGTEQNRKTYARHGAVGDMFGVSFAFLATLVKRIGVDHDLARALFETKNLDARKLALKIADPDRVTPEELDRWTASELPRMCGGYVAMLAAESPHGRSTAERWLASVDPGTRCAGWGLAAQLASRDRSVPGAWFEGRLAALERGIHEVSDGERYARNGALIAFGGRSAGLRDKALAAARRIGHVEVDHGETYCQTPDAAAYIRKNWAHAVAKGFESPGAQESARMPPRIRC